jgi:large subunit ribosomal protein L23
MNQERVFKVLLGPHVSEKATVLADKRPVRFQGCY